MRPTHLNGKDDTLADTVLGEQPEYNPHSQLQGSRLEVGVTKRRKNNLTQLGILLV